MFLTFPPKCQNLWKRIESVSSEKKIEGKNKKGKKTNCREHMKAMLTVKQAEAVVEGLVRFGDGNHLLLLVILYIYRFLT